MPAAARRPGPGTYSRRVLVLLEQRGPQTARDLARALRPRQRRGKPFADAAERRMWHARQERALKRETARVQSALDQLVRKGWVAPATPRLADGVADLIEAHGYARALWLGAVDARVSGGHVTYLDESHGDRARAVEALRAVAEHQPTAPAAPLAWLASQDLIEPAGLRCLVSDLPSVPTPPKEAPMSRPKLHLCGRSTTSETTTETLYGRRFRVVRHRCEVCGRVAREDRHELGGGEPKGAA